MNLKKVNGLIYSSLMYKYTNVECNCDVFNIQGITHLSQCEECKKQKNQ